MTGQRLMTGRFFFFFLLAGRGLGSTLGIVIFKFFLRNEYCTFVGSFVFDGGIPVTGSST